MNNQQSGQLIDARRIEILKRAQEEVMEGKERIENRDDAKKEGQMFSKGRVLQKIETESLIQSQPRVLDKRMYDTFADSFVEHINSIEKEIQDLMERLSALEQRRMHLDKELQELDAKEHSLYKRMRLLMEIKDRLDQWVLFLNNPNIP